MDVYNKLYNKFEELYASNKNFSESVEYIYNCARQIDKINGVNNMFIKMIIWNDNLTNEEFDTMVGFGGDFSHNNYLPFICLLEKGDPNRFSYIIDKYNVDVNVIMDHTFSKPICDENLNVLIEKGLDLKKITKNFFRNINTVDKIKLLLDYGADYIKILEYVLEYNKYNSTLVNLFIRELIETNNSYNIDGNLINQLLGSSNFGNLSIDEIEAVFEMGADPRYNNDIFFVYSGKNPNPEVVLMFLNKYGVNINASNSNALYRAITYYCYDTAKVLLENGIKINRSSIVQAIKNGQVFLDLLLEYGTDPIDLAKVLVHETLGKLDLNINCFKKLIKKDVDINQIILNYDN